MKRPAGLATLFLLAGAPSAAMAHHSAAMFDRTKTVTVVGTVKDFQWTNPHCWLRVVAPNPAGGTTDWSIEMTSPNLLMRAGWRPGTLKIGDKITVVTAPLRDGSMGGQFLRATTGDGRQLSNDAASSLAPSTQ